MPRTDVQLVSAVRQGDPTAFPAIYGRYRAELVRHAVRRLGEQQASAEDVVQDAFIRAHRVLSRGTAEIVLRPWLHRIVRNAAIDECRRAACRRTLARALEDARPPSAAADVAALRDEARAVLHGIAMLPDRQRTAVVRHVLQGAPHEELARELHISVTASKGLVFRARSGLAQAA